MTPDGSIPDISSELEGDDVVISVARALFAVRNNCAVADVDNLLDHPDLQQEFDELTDQVAVDPLVDVCPIAVDRGCFGNLASIGLVNPVPVRIATGVAISGHSPRQRERAVANRKRQTIASWAFYGQRKD